MGNYGVKQIILMVKLYDYNGQLLEEVNYIDGLIQGILKSYHENGLLWKEVNYIDGKKYNF